MDISAPLAFSFPHAIAFWAVAIWALAMEARQIKSRKQNSADHGGVDRYSGLVISYGSSVASLLSFSGSFLTASRFDAAWVLPLFWAGLAIVVGGMFLRMHCWRELGRFFTHTVTIANEHKVVDTGAYKLLRHPSYTGALLTHIGTALALSNWLAVLFMVGGNVAIYLYRITTEEAALAGALGEPYREFMRTRKRLIPFIY